MLDALVPTRSPLAARALHELVASVPRMPEGVRRLWATRTAHIYGDLDGQRRLDAPALAAELGLEGFAGDLNDLLFALQTYVVLLADLCAVAALQPSSREFLGSVAELPDAEFRSWLGRVSSGEALGELGVHGGGGAFHFDWYAAALEEPSALKPLCSLLAEGLDELAGGDPFGSLYARVMPKNLLHALGEFYTPPWLAELLLGELDWAPGQTLIDPFCGSGVFLLAALRQAGSGLEALPSLCGIDLNPVSCALCRANLVLALRAEIQASSLPTWLPVLCADTMAAAVLRSQDAAPRQVMVDGELTRVPEPEELSDQAVAEELLAWGIRLERWLPEPGGMGTVESALSRGQAEQLAALRIAPADLLVTNPPWVGWEYLSRPYRDYVQPGWHAYGLFTARGREAAFVKEDISTLALVTAWDRHLAEGGRSVAVLRASTMTSTLASRGMRRLRLSEDAGSLQLRSVHDFGDLRVFPTAQTDTASWTVHKGAETSFPVSCQRWGRSTRRWQPAHTASLDDVLAATTRSEQRLQPADPADPSGRWMIGDARCMEASARLRGPCPYVGRTGVFTGGANAVFYLERSGGPGQYRNVVQRAKRAAPQVEVELEQDLVYELVRGRDLATWQVLDHGLLLCPHTAETKLRAIAPEQLANSHPKALAYLRSMRPILDARKGFSGWERTFQQEAFYAIQRVGEYTFSPYKVAWKYIAKAFTVAVLGPDAQGRPRLPNDKVMSVAVAGPEEAYYLCGVLSSSPARWQVTSQTTGRQVSASAIANLGIPRFDPGSELHLRIAAECEAGHAEVDELPARLEAVDRLVADLFSLDRASLRAFQRELRRIEGPTPA